MVQGRFFCRFFSSLVKSVDFFRGIPISTTQIYGIYETRDQAINIVLLGKNVFLMLNAVNKFNIEVHPIDVGESITYGNLA